jgi:hypothetical protein
MPNPSPMATKPSLHIPCLPAHLPAHHSSPSLPKRYIVPFPAPTHPRQRNTANAYAAVADGTAPAIAAAYSCCCSSSGIARHSARQVNPRNEETFETMPPASVCCKLPCPCACCKQCTWQQAVADVRVGLAGLLLPFVAEFTHQATAFKVRLFHVACHACVSRPCTTSNLLEWQCGSFWDANTECSGAT